jgi:hypothetical protein
VKTQRVLWKPVFENNHALKVPLSLMIKMMRKQPVFSRATRVFALLGFLSSGGFDLATAQEFGHPLFRGFRMGSHGPVGQVLAVAEDAQGPMLFGCRNAILTFDNYRWSTITAPETGSISGLAVDDAGTVWFSTGTQIGYLSSAGSERHAVKVYSGSLGANSKVICFGHKIYFGTEKDLLTWNNGYLSVQPWTNDSIDPVSIHVRLLVVPVL